MQNFSLLKQKFLKRWIKGLQICSSSSKNMGVLERKNAIKLSADLAMAFTKKGRTSWSRAVIAEASKNNQGNTKYCKILSQRLMIIKKASNLSPNDKNMRSFRSRKVMKRSYRSRVLRKNSTFSPHNKVLPSSLLAKRLVQKRTQVLKRLVPGGDQCLDEASLIKEALDYILSLRAQVDVMRCIAKATHDHELVNGK